MTGTHAPADTNGYFEVELQGATIHSKKDGMGHCDTSEKEDVVMNAIASALEALTLPPVPPTKAEESAAVEGAGAAASATPEVTIEYCRK